MKPDENDPQLDDNPSRPRTPDNELPQIEDAYAPNGDASEDVGEDEPQLLNGTSRALASTEEGAEQGENAASTQGIAPTQSIGDDLTDAGGVGDESEITAPEAPEPTSPDWGTEVSAHRIVVELKRIEADVRALLEGRDPKRKRKLGGTRRWLELEDDILSWRHSNRMGETTLNQLHELVARRHYLFQRLKFLAGTRPTWNS